jgi:hypothetical protein
MAYKFQRGSAILSGALLQEGDVEIESGFSLKIGSAEMSETDLEKLDGITDGTAAASKALVLDTNRDVSGVHAFTLSGSSSGQQQSKVIFGDSENTKIERIHDSGDELVRFISSDAGIDISGSHDLGVAIYGGDGEDAGVVIESANGLVLKNAAGNAAAVDLAQDGSISGSNKLEMGGTVRLDGAGDATLNVAQDSLYFFDLTDNLMKRDTMTDYATAIAGDGLGASSGVLAVNVDDTGIEIDSDALRLKDSGVVTAKIADDAVTPAKMSLFDDSLAATDTHILIADGTDYSSFAMSGDATLSNAGVLTIAANAVEDSMVNDNVATGLAGVGLAASSGVMSLDLSELSDAAVASGDKFAMLDATDNSTKLEGIDDIATLFAGDGLAAASAVLAVQVSGAAVIHSDKVGITGSIAGAGLTFAGSKDHISGLSLDLSEYSTVQVASGDKFLMLDSDGATEQMETVDSLVEFMAGDGLAHSSGVLSLDLNELTAADVAVAADFIAIVDADDNSTKKESIADLVSAMAGAGLTAASGQLSVTGNDVHPKADGDTLQEGYNYFATINGANVGVDLPASPSVGDVVHVKAGDIQTDHVLRISAQGSHLIDGEATIDLESPFAAVSLVYVVANAWRIV